MLQQVQFAKLRKRKRSSKNLKRNKKTDPLVKQIEFFNFKQNSASKI